MSFALRDLEKYIGSYTGAGVNHEKQNFSGQFCLSPVIASKAFEVIFKAVGNDGTIYHEEKTLITHTPQKQLGLWTVSNNTPFMMHLEFREEKVIEGSQRLIFGLNNPSDKTAFREEIHLELTHNKIGYHFYWGMPGGEFAYRSGLLMARTFP